MTLAQFQSAKGTISLFFCTQPLSSAFKSSFHWKDGNNLHSTHFSLGLQPNSRGLSVKALGVSIGVYFGGSSWLAMSLFQPSTYWNKIAIYPFDSWSSTCPWRIKDKKMSRCPEGAFHSDSFLCHFWGSLWAQASLAALWQAGTWEGLWGTD